ncbi:phage tail protein [Azospirillum rugosum]|uniref:Microcystin-dependent protein n=1 Tax=Azospirillum rugosum TaxID=416170 RepID=A0ABS4SKG1_9PROT|nr:tail fiber protein [Azospirillum rugosum]MBP2293041.1 microcystin-dependent protein [Azospirillum rugosum]MDQ0526590.1 microcystin-dependent protein [Azospirillum rugosum]
MNNTSLALLALAGTAAVLAAAPASACETEPYIGSVCAIVTPYCPQYFLPANGQPLQVVQYQALYALIGNTYGGTPGSTFNLPNLQGRMVVGAGSAPGLTTVKLGAASGQNTVTTTLAPSQIPATPSTATIAAPATPPAGSPPPPTTTLSYLAPPTAAPMPVVIPTQPPQLGLTYCIAVQGAFPTRTD